MSWIPSADEESGAAWSSVEWMGGVTIHSASDMSGIDRIELQVPRRALLQYHGHPRKHAKRASHRIIRARYPGIRHALSHE
jgi:hypothetical protein